MTTEGTPALVVGADNTTGLQTARLLAARGIPVIGLAADRGHYCCRTRALDRVVATPTSGAGLVATLDRLADELDGPAVLVPCTDASVATVARARPYLPMSLRMSLPDADVVDTLLRKDTFAQHAARHGIPIPPTHLVTDSRTAAQVPAAIGFPCVVKPPVKTPAWQRLVGKVATIATEAEWRERWASLHALARPLVVQAWVPGGEDQLISCNAFAFADGGEPITFVSRKLRQWPRGTGTTSLGEVVDEPAVADLTRRLLATVPYHGLLYLEVKRTATGGLVVIEPNVGRPTGRSALAEACGVELVHNLYRDALGLPPVPSQLRRTDVKWIHWRRDLQAAAAARRAGELGLATWVRSVRGPKARAVLDLRDPGPGLGELRHTLRRARRSAAPTAGKP